MDLFGKLGKEMKDLFQDLFHPEKKAIILEKIEGILKVATQIGGQVAEEAKALHEDVVLYLKHPKNKKFIDKLKKLALKIKQETREL